VKCEFCYCVYNKNNRCISDEIEIDSLGMCRSCEMVSIPDTILQELKQKRLKQIEDKRKDSNDL